MSSPFAALGGVLQIVRGIRGWSVETAAREAHMGHMTWRRIEDGQPVREKTYGQVEACLGLGSGLIRRALTSPSTMIVLANDLGIDVSSVEQGLLTEGGFLDQLARTVTERKDAKPSALTDPETDDVAAALREIADAMRTGLGQIAEAMRR